MDKTHQRQQILKTILLLFIIITTNYSCHPKQKFDKEKWAEVAELMTFPNRKYMIDDLVQNYQLKGKTYHEIVELLGQPQSNLDSTLQVFYDIDVDYGWDIDPVYSKTLTILFDKDTIVKSFEVQEWKK
jgi:hypothetical protein